MDSRCGSEVSASGSIQMQRSQRLYQRFLTDAAAGLSFSHDSMVGLGADGVSYSQADFRQLFRPTGALKPSAKTKTQGRKLCTPAPRPKGRRGPPERFGGLFPLLESLESEDHSQTVELLQDSCSRTRVTVVSSVGHYLKRASGVAKPDHKVGHRDHNHIILDNSSQYHNRLQRWSSPATQRQTDPDKMAAHPNKKSLKRDLTDLADQVQTAVVTSCSPAGQRLQSGRTLHGPQSSDCAGTDGDDWMAAQRPALDGDHSTMVIQRLLAQLFLSLDLPDGSLDTQLVISLLTHLSSQTTLVRSLLAEQLNSSEWSCRQLACNTLSSLTGPINKDVVHKLTHLMCNDQSCRVRLAAAEALMKLGKMQDVHSELRLKLEEGRSLQDKMEALDIISHLKLMTASLLEPLVSCFSDEFTAVRKHACLTAASLLLKDETVVSRLLELLENDPAQEVRLSAITAVGALGLSSSDVQETLQRCVETEEEAELRLAACRLLHGAGVPPARLQDFLLQRINVEPNWQVRRTMKEMLHLCDGSLQEDRCDAEYVSLQVKRLSEWSVITEKVLLLEKLQVGGSPGSRVRRRILAKLLSQRYCLQQDA